MNDLRGTAETVPLLMPTREACGPRQCASRPLPVRARRADFPSVRAATGAGQFPHTGRPTGSGTVQVRVSPLRVMTSVAVAEPS